MKLPSLLAAIAALALMPPTQKTPAASAKPADKLASAVFDWEKLSVIRTPITHRLHLSWPGSIWEFLVNRWPSLWVKGC